MRAAVVLKIPGQEVDEEQKPRSEKFKLHISEKGAKFDEDIEIDEEKDIEYFKVPPHNELSETDNIYDFKMNITVTRVKEEGVCHISPLPSDMPRPNVLSQGLKMLSSLPPTHKIEKTIQQWKVGDMVDKWTLRPEVRDFCGQFPVYRLEPFTPDSVSVGRAGDEGYSRASRTRRDVEFPLCDNSIPPCFPNRWLYKCKIQTSRCVYYVTCKVDSQQKVLSCASVTRHLYHGLVCCTPRCS